MFMPDYEYEVTFHYELVNVSTIVYINEDYVGDGENDHYGSLKQKAIEHALQKIGENINFSDEHYDDVSVSLTGMIGG